MNNQVLYHTVLESDAPEFMGDVNPTLPTPSSWEDIERNLSLLPPPPPLYKPAATVTTQYLSPAPVNTFMQPATTGGHSTRDAILGIANQGLDFLSKFYASKSPAFAAQSGVGYAPVGGPETYAQAGGVDATGAGVSVGAGVGSFADGIINWVKMNTGLTAMIVLGVYLYTRDPKRR